MRRSPQLALGFALAAFFLWLALRNVDGAALAAAARGVSPAWVAAAPLVLALGYLCRILRWQSMLRRHNPELSLGRSTVAIVGSIAVNNLLPLRAGDALRTFGFSRWLGVPSSVVLATVLIERLLDMVILILALALALWAFSLDIAAVGLARSGGTVLAVFGIISLLLLLRPRLLGPVFAGLTRVAPVFGPAARYRIAGFLGPLRDTLADLSGRHAMPALMVWSVLVWFFEGATYWVLARSIPALTAPEAAWLAMPTGTLSTLLPSSPGHVGTFDYFAQLATTAAGNPLAEATAFVLITHAVLWLTTTLIGGVCLLIWALSRSGSDARPA